MEPIKLGMVGSGYWGSNLIRNFMELPQSEVVAVADLSEARRAYVSERYPGTTVTSDYRTFFEMGLQAVVVATPPAAHHPIALDCLQHGLHVLVEKPITLNSHHAEELVRVADQQHLVLMAGHTFVYNSAVQKLKEIITSGELGEIYYINTRRLNLGMYQRDVSALWDLAPHDLSILHYLLDSNPTQVRASGRCCLLPDVVDIASVDLRYPNGVLAHIQVSWLDPLKVRTVTIVGSKKMVVYDDVEATEKIKIYDKSVETLPYTESFGEFQLQYHYGDIVVPYVHFVEPLRMECEHFLKCIQNGTEPRSSGRSGLDVVRVLEAADRSILSGETPVPL